jgi:hypothetical protein
MHDSQIEPLDVHVTPVSIEYGKLDPETCCVPFKWRTTMYIEDNLGFDPGDPGGKLLNLLHPSASEA